MLPFFRYLVVTGFLFYRTGSDIVSVMKIPKNAPKHLPEGFRHVAAGEVLRQDDVVTDRDRKPIGLVVGVGKQFATIFAFESRKSVRVFKVLQSDSVVCDGYLFMFWRQ